MKKNYSKIYRILDANLNRASEGIRVLEDTFRFVKNDKVLFEKLREIRHKLNKALIRIYPKLILFRDTGTDHGREAAEHKFKNIGILIIANFKRVEQALRVLEEYSRLIPANETSANRELKKIRFEMYLLEKEINR